MSFLKKLFGGGSGAESSAGKIMSETTHAGYLIQAMPMKEGGQYRLCALVSKEIGGETKTHKLIRADMFASSEQAADLAIQKAKQVIAERGDGMFD